MRPGARLSIDVGSVRVGVARSDPDALVATPVATLARRAGPDPAAGGDDLDAIATLVEDLAVVEVVVGLPLRLAGGEGSAAAAARRYAEVVARRVAPVPVRLVDERLTTVTATRSLRDAGRGQRSQRQVVDQVAAVVILQAALDAERSSGRAPGHLVTVAPEPSPTAVEEQP